MEAEYVLSYVHFKLAGKKMEVDGTNTKLERGGQGAGRNAQSVKWLQCGHKDLTPPQEARLKMTLGVVGGTCL